MTMFFSRIPGIARTFEQWRMSQIGQEVRDVAVGQDIACRTLSHDDDDDFIFTEMDELLSKGFETEE